MKLSVGFIDILKTEKKYTSRQGEYTKTEVKKCYFTKEILKIRMHNMPIEHYRGEIDKWVTSSLK